MESSGATRLHVCTCAVIAVHVLHHNVSLCLVLITSVSNCVHGRVQGITRHQACTVRFVTKGRAAGHALFTTHNWSKALYKVPTWGRLHPSLDGRWPTRRGATATPFVGASPAPTGRNPPRSQLNVADPVVHISRHRPPDDTEIRTGTRHLRSLAKGRALPSRY
jgi:hypothetical protein